MKKFFVAAAVLVAMGSAAIAAQDSVGDSARQTLSARVMSAMDRLDLDQGQRDQVKAVLKKNLPAVKPNILRLVQEHRALKEVMRTSPADAAAIRAQSAKVAAVQSDIAIQRASLNAELRAVLRPEQVAEFEKMEKEFQTKVDERLSRIGSVPGSE
jgi:Spy/CpxP family protein refolding chaperone